MRSLFLHIILFWISGCFAQADSLRTYTCQEDHLLFAVSRLSLNTPQADYSPFLLNNTLYFVSTRPSRAGVVYTSASSQEGLSDVFQAEKRDSVRFVRATLFPAISTPYNEGPCSMSSDGKQLYYTGSSGQSSGKNKDAPLLRILYTACDGKSWSTPQEPAFCRGPHTYAHPALSPDQQVLVFASDRPGGYGGMDLYATSFNSGKWSEPVNLGPRVNTASHEVFPFISKSGLLYFSSGRTGGAGGLDLYAFPLDSSKGSSSPQALSAPLNTAFDDFGIWTDSAGLSGYLSSNRSGNDDIFYFSAIQPDFSKAETPPSKTSFCYTFYEETAVETADSSGFSYEWDLGDGTRSRQLRTRHCYSRPGTYQVSLNAVEKGSGAIVANQLTYELTIERPPGLYINFADSAAIQSDVLFDAAQCQLRGYELKTVYWDFGDGTYSKGPYVKHCYEAPGKYMVRLGVVAVNAEQKKETLFKTVRYITVLDH